MSYISQLEKSIRLRYIVILVNIAFLWIALLVQSHYFRSSMESFMELAQTQNRFNDKVVLAIESLTSTTQYNFEFNKTNKLLIKRIIETELPDEVALLGKLALEEKNK